MQILSPRLTYLESITLVLLKGRPFPTFLAPYVSVKAWQFGHNTVRLSGEWLLACPSMWST